MAGGSADWEELKRLQRELIDSQKVLGSKLDKQIDRLDEQIKEIKAFNRSSSILSEAMIFIGVVSLFIAGFAFYFQFMASPKLNVIFHDINPKEYLFELRVENTGIKYADGAKVHLLLPKGVTLKFEGVFAKPTQLPNIEIGEFSNYEFDVHEKILVRRNAVIGKIQFVTAKLDSTYTIGHLVATPGMKDKYGTFILDGNESKMVQSVAMGRPATADTVRAR